ncbi:MAG: flagellar biosynthetic protein FliR [Planctomycetota bacterium]
MLDIGDLLGIAEPTLFAAFLVFLRVGAVMALLPAFGEMMVPVRVKVALALALALLVAPAVIPTVPAELPVLRAAGAEIVTGLVHGFALRLFIFVLQIAGTVAAQSTSLSQLFGGDAIDPQPALGVVLVLGGLALATLLGFHVRIVSMLIESYAHFPAGVGLPPNAAADWAVGAVTSALRVAVVLAMPFMLASLLYNLALGVINRAMPQLMVAFVGAPAITLGALVLLAVSAPLVLSVWAGLLLEQVSHPLGVFNGR